MSIQLTTSVEIEQPASLVWGVVAEYGNDPAWRKGVASMEASPAGTVVPGQTTREVLRMAGRTFLNAGEVLEVAPGRSFSWRTTSGAVARGSRTVEALGADRCRVRLVLEVEPQGVELLMAPLLRRMLSRNLHGDGRRLAALVQERADRSQPEVATGAL